MISSHNSGIFPSPGTPNYWDGSVGGIQKGWSSEGVPLPAGGSRRHTSAAALMPFNSGRTLPSKWEDAERWITSPVSGYGIGKASVSQSQRQPKSKSGPLGSPGVTYYSNYSPAMPVLDGGSVRNLVVGSPFSTGVMVADGLSIHCSGGNGGQSYLVHTQNSMARSASVAGWSDLLSKSSLPISQDDKLDGTKDAETMVSPVVSQRDMATQMSPNGSTHSSPNGKPLFSPSPPRLLPIVEPQSDHSAKLEIRDVQVDKRATVVRLSRKHGAQMTMKGLLDVEDFKKEATEARASSCDIAEEAKKISKPQREEARITAWENLQKAKAEAAIRKLEMKLEKKKSSSMDKILNKLRVSQMKAQEMRSSLSDSQAHQGPRTSHKVVSSHKNFQKGSLSSCFTCHPRTVSC